MTEEVVTLEPKEMARATIKCVCLGEYAKATIAEELERHAEDIVLFQRERPFAFESSIKEAALGRAKQLRELADLIKKLPTCPIVTE